MKFSQFGRSAGFGVLAALCVASLFAAGPSALGDDRQVLPGHVPGITTRLQPLSRLESTTKLNLAIGLPLRNTNELNTLLQQIYDPVSPNYHHYLTPKEFADRFCAASEDYQALVDFANSHHLNVTVVHPNRMLLDVSGSVADIESAFQIQMQLYQHPKEHRTFYAPTTNPSIPSGLRVADISGLNNYVLPHPNFRTQGASILHMSGSGPGGNYIGDDFRAAYVPNVTLTGAGQKVGLFQLDGYFASDITAYESLAGRTNIPLLNVLLDGFDGVPTGNGGEVEVSLDIEMVVSMAPGLSEVIVYEGGPFGIPNDVLNRMATDDLAEQLSASWSWGGGPQATTDQIFKEMAAQGQSYFNACGDFDAWLPGYVDNPDYPFTPISNPYITVVGGTTLTTVGPAGARISETVWNYTPLGDDGAGTGGGSSSYYPIPSWQQGVDMTANMGSRTFRNMPDVALTADGVYVIADEGIPYPGTAGTSCATPLWAAFTSLVNQRAQQVGSPPVGFINPAVYAIGLSSIYTNCFNDITNGNNAWSESDGLYPAVPGYDLCTGWGTPAGLALINALAPPASTIDLLVFTNIISGGNGNGIIDFAECNNLDIVLTNSGRAGATGVQVTLSSLTPGAIVAQNTSAYSDIPAGGFATNSVPFEISTSSNFVCGDPVVLSMVVKTDQGSAIQNDTLASGVSMPVVQLTNSTAVGIPDNSPSGASSFITVNNLASTLDVVTVSVYVSHPRVSDLTLKLIGPDGTTVTLAGTNVPSGANYGVDCQDETIFSDAAALPVQTGTPPFLGVFRPVQPLAAFAGKSGSALNGNWQLHVVDSVAGDTGSIQCWSLSLATSTCTNGGGLCPGVDLAVGISAQPDPVTLSSNLTYTIIVTNNGPNVATGASVLQTLPQGATYVSGSASQGSVSYSAGSVNCGLGDILPTATATITVIVQLNSTGVASSTATASSFETDINPANNSATTVVVVNPPFADLALGMTANASSLPLGGILTYTVAVTNRGPVTAASVFVTNTFSTNVSVTSIDSSQGSPSLVQSGEVVTALGTLNKGSFATVTLQIRAITVGVITATASCGSSATDPIPGNNNATVLIPVVPSADLALTMTGSPASVAVGSNITYTLSVQNFGPSAAASVVINDPLPSGVTNASGSATAGTFAISGGLATCTITNLPAGSNATVTIVVNTAPLSNQVPVTIVNSATVSSSAADPNLANNSASVSTRVDIPRAVVVPDGSILAAESFVPTNGFIDPGETVTVDFRLQNIGNLNTTNLVANLQASGGVVLTNGPQSRSYGSMAAGGAGAVQPFTFAANVTNGGTLTATLQLQDGSSNLGTAVFTFVLPVVSTFANTNNIVIPDHGEAPPYPSVITVSGVSNLISKVTVTLTNVNHTYPDDIDILLTGPAGQSTLLESHCGGGGVLTNVSITYDDLAAAYLPTASQITSGTYKPTQNGTVSFPLTNTPAAPYGSNFARSFDGINANGNWSLYVFDSSPGDSGIIVGGWSLAIATGTPVNDIADLGVSGVASPNGVLAGNNLTYTFTVTNNGPNAANSVAFTNSLPASESLVSAVSSAGICGTNASGSVYCTLTNLPAGAIFMVTVVATPSQPGTITNIATVTSSESDLNQDNNTALVVTTVSAPSADLAVSQSASPNPAAFGQSFVYTIIVTNNGPGLAYNAVVSEPLRGLTFGSITSPPGPAGSNISGTATCALGNIPAGGFTTVLLTVTPPQLGLYTNTVTVSSSSTDPVPTNNSFTSVVTAATPAPNIIGVGAVLLPGGLTSANGAINPGETVTVSFVVTNGGTAATSNLVASLLATNGVTPIGNAQQTYGALAPGGPVGSNSFTFSAAGVNGGQFAAVLQLQDGVANLGTVSFNFTFPTTNTFASASGNALNNGVSQPYPSPISVSGLTGPLAQATVTISNLSHSFPSDIEMLLVGPNGQNAVLMASAGGAYAITNVNVTFDDTAGATLPRNGQIGGGASSTTNKLSNFGLVAPFPSPAPATPYGGSLGVFDGGIPNGVWSLYVLDDSTADSGSFSGWSLNLVTVNPVNGAADLAVTLANPPGLVVAGRNFNYTMGVTNAGPSAATDVVLTQTIPANFNFVSSSPSGIYIPGTLTLNLGTLAAGTNLTVTVTVNPPTAGTYSSTASINADQTDLNPANNSSTVPTTIIMPSPATLTATGLNGGTFLLSVNGIPGTYVLQGSIDLATWTPINTNVVPALGVLQLNDPSAGSYRMRYYRVVFTGP